VAVPTMMCVIIVYASNEEFKIIRKETRNGFVRPSAYLLARTVIELPVMLLLAVFALGVGGFGIMNFQASVFFPIVFVWAANLWSFECVAQVFSVLFTNPLIGMMSFVMYWFGAFVFAGMFVPVEDIVWPFRIFAYTMPLKYALRSTIYLDFHGSTFNCGASGNLMSDNDICTPMSGGQVLDFFNQQRVFKMVSDSDQVGRDIGILLAIGAAFKLMYFGLLLAKASNTAPVHAPTHSNTNRAIGTVLKVVEP